MATYNNQQVLSLEAGADLSAGQFLLVKAHSVANQVVLAGNGENAIGVLVEPADAAGKEVTVAIGGKLRAYAGATTGIGVEVASDAAGKIVPAATTDAILGISTTAGVTGGMIEFVWRPNGRAA